LLDFQNKIHYNLAMISHSVQTMPELALVQGLLAAGIFCMALIAISLLRKRRLTLNEYLAWGLVVILVPVIGPFIIVWIQPGKSGC
jgi:hypothetical protein